MVATKTTKTKATKRKTTRRRIKSGNPPQYLLKMKERDPNVKSPAQNVIGSGWDTKDGEGISILLRTGISLSWRDCKDYYISLWPVDD